MPKLKIKLLPKLRYVLFGVFLYVVFLVFTFPANLAYSYWKQTLGKRVPVTLTSLSGSIWSGKAGSSKIGAMDFDSLEWRLHPQSLLMGKAEIHWSFKVNNGYAKGYAGVNVLGNVSLQDVEGLLPVTDVARAVNMGALRPDGSLTLDLDSVQVKGKIPTSITGNITWHNAEVTLLKPMSLGGLQVKFETTDEKIKGVLSDDGGPLEAQGLLGLTPAGDYNLNLALSVRDPKQGDLVNALRSLGRPDNRGKYHIKRSGKLANLRI